MNLLVPGLIAISIFGLSGCQGAFTPRGQSASATPESRALEGHLAALEQQIAELERGLGKGRGTYREGSLLRVEGDRRSEPPLERLRRLERELADSRAQASANEARIASLTRELASARDRSKDLSEQNSDLTFARDALVTAQQALAERQAAADGLRAQLATSELQRLKAEREHYLFASRLLKLTAGQTAPMLDLQEDVRETVRSLERGAESRQETPAAPVANPPAPAHDGGHH